MMVPNRGGIFEGILIGLESIISNSFDIGCFLVAISKIIMPNAHMSTFGEGVSPLKTSGAL